MGKTEDLNSYLNHKHLGGESNQKGTSYEDYYAVYQIVSCISKYQNSLYSVKFKTQLEGSFVDDMMISYPEQNVYHQLKNTKSLSWGNVDKKGDIAFDFAHQIEYCMERNEKFALKLVYSLKDSKIGEDMPEQIKDHTSAEYFDYSEDLNRLVMVSDPLKHALRAIAFDGQNAPTDDLANIAVVFLGAWKACGARKEISLQEIVQGIEGNKYINPVIYHDASMNDECRRILDAIDGFEYQIRGRMLYWRIGHMNGSCPWPAEMETEIIRRNPTDKWKLISMLS